MWKMSKSFQVSFIVVDIRALMVIKPDGIFLE